MTPGTNTEAAPLNPQPAGAPAPDQQRESPPPDWSPPPVTLVIAASPRTGSTWLCRMMTETGVLGAPREYFGRGNQRLLGEGIEEDVLVRCRTVRERGTTANGVAAVKLFPAQFDWLATRIRLTEWFPNLVWLHLRRRNLVAQAVSRALLAMKPDVPDIPPVDSIGWHVRSIALQEARWRVHFARNAIQPLELWYEDMVADAAGELRRIAAQAGVEQLPEITIGIKTTSDPRLAVWRAAYLEQAASPDLLDNLDRAKGARRPE